MPPTCTGCIFSARDWRMCLNPLSGHAAFWRDVKDYHCKIEGPEPAPLTRTISGGVIATHTEEKPPCAA